MSRFGLRKRLRGLVGGRGRPDIIRHPVTFILPDGREQVVETEEHYTLLMTSQMLPAPIGTGRRAGSPCPDGACGFCRVEALDPTGLSPRSDTEVAAMEAHARGEPHEGRPREPGATPGPKTRLACHARVLGPGARVKVDALVDYDVLKGETE